RIPLWLLTLAAGLVAGVLSWFGGEVTQNAFPVTFQIPPEVSRMGGYQKTAMLSLLEGQARRAAERKKTTAAYGLLGALLGVALGLAGGLSRSSPRPKLSRAAVGGLVAGATGAALSWVLVPVFYQLQEAAQAAQYSQPDAPSGLYLIHFLVHGGICAGI